MRGMAQTLKRWGEEVPLEAETLGAEAGMSAPASSPTTST